MRFLSPIVPIVFSSSNFPFDHAMSFWLATLENSAYIFALSSLLAFRLWFLWARNAFSYSGYT